MAAPIFFPLPKLRDGRRALVSSPFGQKRSLRRSDIGAADFVRRCGKLDTPPKFDENDPCKHRRHLGADIVFRREGKAAPGEDNDADQLDDDTPNEKGEGFKYHFVPRGHPVVATEKGTVLRTGRANGFFVALLHEDSPVDGGNSTVYVHLDTLNVKVGQSVLAGQQLGTVGAGTNGGRRHLHFDRLTGAAPGVKGRVINPSRYLKAAQPIPIPTKPFLVAIALGISSLVGAAFGFKSKGTQ